ncbi:TPA: serine--tRNA ligase, partial [Clostridioides difficile]|nr:serine--tRNA ligase [Clostridioides difficile]
MLDIKRIRENLDCIKKAMERRGEKAFNLDEVVKLDDERRKILQEVEVMKNKLNTASKNIPNLIKEGKDVENEKIKLKDLSDKIKVIDQNLK